MNKYAKIFLFGLFVFIGCEDEDKFPYTELEWIKVESSITQEQFLYYLDTPGEVGEVYEDSFPNWTGGPPITCKWIHYYKDDNYFNFGLASMSSSDDVGTVDLLNYFQIEYSEK